MNAQYFARPPSPESVDASQPPTKKRKTVTKPNTQPPTSELLTPREFNSANTTAPAFSTAPSNGDEPQQTSTTSAVPLVPKAKSVTHPERTTSKRAHDNVDGTSASVIPAPAPAQSGPPTKKQGSLPTAGSSTARNPNASSASAHQPRPAPPKKRKIPPSMDLFIPKKKK